MQEKNISINNFEQCIKCAVCTAYCPVLKTTPIYPGPKKGGPDGERLRLKNKLFFEENLKLCLNCKRCEVVCPSGVKIADIIQSARAQYGESGVGLRDRILANTDFIGTMASPFSAVINPVLGTEACRFAMDKLMGIDRHRMFPEYSSEKFTSWFRKEASTGQKDFSRRVTYFHGCYAQYNYPKLGKDLVKVMNAIGYGVDLLEDEKCCGVAMISNGLYKHAVKNASANISSIRKAGNTVITTSSTCTFTMRDEYPDILNLDNSDIRDNIVLAVKFIYEKVASGEVRLAFKDDWFARAAYHVPCHMEKLGWSIFTIGLMDMIPGMKLFELDSNCCGIAGTYGFKKENYERSQAIGAPLFAQIEKREPEFIICECETCKWQIEMSTGYTVMNPISVLAEALDLGRTAALNCSGIKGRG